MEAVRDRVFKVVKSHCRVKKMRKDFVDKELRHLTSRRRKLDKRKNDSVKWKSVMDCLIGKIKSHLISRDKKVERKAVGAIKVNPKYFYTHVKKNSKVKSSVAPLERADGSLTVDPLEKANLLQHQFASVFSNPAAIDPSVAAGNIEDLGEILTTMDFSQNCIQSALEELKPFSASPPGCIPSCILKRCNSSLSYPIWMLWNKSFEDGAVPNCLKQQFITPIFKKGSKSTTANYRPVSITSHLSKVFERLVRKRIADYLDEMQLQSETQHGFRKGRSTMSQLLSHVDYILTELCGDREVDVLYLDFSKAFDSVDINVLLAKLKRYGIGGKLHQWISAWILGRQQCVMVDGVRSPWVEVLSGVAQGSVLGPLLFLIYILDLESVLDGSMCLTFADDTKLMKAITDIVDQEGLQSDLLKVTEWAKINNMVLHDQKFQLLSYRLNKSAIYKEFPFTVDICSYTTKSGVQLFPEADVRDLGVQMSSDGSWSKHIATIVRRASLLSGWIFSVFRDRSPEVMLQLFKSLVRPILEYCCLVWDPSKSGDIKSIENVQRCFTRRLDGMQNLDYWERLKVLNLMSLQRRRQRYMLIHVWKTIHGFVPNSANLVFQHSARLGMRLVPPVFPYRAETWRANQYHSSFGPRAAHLWNRLPAAVNSCGSLGQFKSSLGNYLTGFYDRPPVRGYPSLPNDISPQCAVNV